MVTATPTVQSTHIHPNSKSRTTASQLAKLRSQPIVVDLDAIPPPTLPLPIPNIPPSPTTATAVRTAPRKTSQDKIPGSPMQPGSGSLRPPPRPRVLRSASVGRVPHSAKLKSSSRRPPRTPLIIASGGDIPIQSEKQRARFASEMAKSLPPPTPTDSSLMVNLEEPVNRAVSPLPSAREDENNNIDSQLTPVELVVYPPERPVSCTATRYYGIESSMRWREGVDPIHKRFSSSNGAWRCQDRFAVFFRPGDDIGPDQVVTKTFWSEAWPYPIETILYGTTTTTTTTATTSTATSNVKNGVNRYSLTRGKETGEGERSGGYRSDHEGDRQISRGRTGSRQYSTGESLLKTAASFPSSGRSRDPRYITSEGVQKIAKVTIPMPDVAIDQMELVKAPVKVELCIYILESPLRNMDPHAGTGRVVLPTNVRPTHYDLTLTPDLTTFNFHGHVLINLDINKPTTAITLNSNQLDIISAKLTNLALKTESSQNATDITLDKDNETVTLTFADELQPGSTAVLYIVFKGVLNESMNGFYRSSFKDDAGKTHYIATTQFEATDARKAFPCWDEPAIKATFDVTLRVPSDLVALSNMNVISDKEVGHTGKVKGDVPSTQKGDVPSTQKGDVPSTQKGDVPSTQKGDVPSTQKGDVPSTQKGDVPSAQKGDVPSTQKGDVPSAQKGDTVDGALRPLKEVKFATTPVMSTYLVAFIVGKFEYIETVTKNLPTPITCRVYVLPGKTEEAEFALSVTPLALEYFTELFGVAYPLPKMDLITIPDFESGAMENWGLVTYRAIRLLFNEKTSDLSYKRHIAYTICHEIAHQWFGNLVTMDWWDYLWLNEGFATWVGNLAVSKFFPEWDNWSYFIADGFQMGLALDGLRSSHPIEVPCKHPHEIHQIFDAISYYKGASCIRMLSSWLGLDVFLEGIRIYIKKHAYKNTSTEDLWAALSEASGVNVGQFMNAWIKQVGYPVVDVEENADASALTFKQSRYLSSGDLSADENTSRWTIPLGIEPAPIDSKNKSPLLSDESITLKLEKGGHYKVNSKYNGFFRTAYPATALTRISQSIKAKDPLFTSDDRVGLLADLGALSKSGHIKTSSLLELLESFENEDQYVVWVAIAERINVLSSVFYQEPEDFQQALQKFQRKLFSKAAAKLGWETQTSDDYRSTLLRKLVITNAGCAGEEAVVKEAQKRFASYVGGNPKALNQNLQSAAFEIVVLHGEEADFEKVLKCWREATATDQKLGAIGALATVRHPALVQQLLQIAISEEVRPQDITYVLAGLSRNTTSRHALWEFIKENWDMLTKRYEGSMALLGNIVKAGVGRFTSEEMAKDCEKFFEGKKVNDISRPIAQSLEVIRSNAKWVARDAEDVREWLSSKGYLA
ncbi:Aminopeptidase 2 mitochondrial [Linnemannia exigua]|uniref:Aminopeptidase 2 mitochondrial n=1 Tax=Linnemannia exigua TaxID=604196 RepID=A0AAD4DAU7_9FUNG|nr:Aminopeptidase 2 mitochondrial [Linnemannia exigua]